MKIRIRIFLYAAMWSFLFVNFGCKKNINDQSPPVGWPVLTTVGISNIGQTSATSGGYITSDGGSVITARGVCWSAYSIPNVDDNKTSETTPDGMFSSTITGLNPATTYFVRAYATNSAGTAYGHPFLFVTLRDGSGTVTDIDGNVYHTVNIGSQTWTVENLNTARFQNGDSIYYINDSSEWGSGVSYPAFCFYEYNPDFGPVYGKLYNWYAVSDSRKIAPTGWHVSSNQEWIILCDYLRQNCTDYYDSGSKLKESDTTHWLSPNMYATNESGFTALPAGNIYWGYFDGIRQYAQWWSSTESYYDPDEVITWAVEYDTYDMDQYMETIKTAGLSVRCVKD